MDTKPHLCTGSRRAVVSMDSHQAPTPLDGLAVGGSRHAVWMVSGLSTGADLMRGEESELLGVLAVPEFEPLRCRALVVLPGTHSKQVRIEGGAVVDFRTFMTGELLELLSTKSLLGVSVETAVILVSYINKLRQEGMDIRTATREASLLRLRPIMMTALVACLGLLPAALSTQSSPYA